MSVNILKNERQFCKEDVCPYCSGHARGYDRVARYLANGAGNYVHYREGDDPAMGGDRVLCKASGIYAREAFQERVAMESDRQVSPTLRGSESSSS